MEFVSSRLQQIASAYSSRTHTNPFHNFFSSSPTTQDPLLSALGLNSSPSLKLILDPPLPPILQPLPSIFRALSVLMLLPILMIALIDFAGYAVFRTLGVHRRRVRVKRNLAEPVASEPVLPFPSSPGSTAPLLSPGSYDAQELLRHRARSASGASDADIEWIRTGGSFARVSAVRARAAATTNQMSQPDVGVDGALGLTDTDVEDSGVESGRTSPTSTFGRSADGKPKIRKGFGFTPMKSSLLSSGPPSPSYENENLDSHVNNLSESLTSLASNKSTADASLTSSNGTNGSWVGISQEEISTRDIAAASDLEPPYKPSLYRTAS